MKILIINYYYSPDDNAHVYRWKQIAQFWVEDGHEVEVLTGRVRGAPSYNIESRVQVSRVGVLRRSIQNAAVTKSVHPRFLRLVKKLLDIARPFYRKIYWPDSMWHWVPSVIYAAIRRRRIKYDLVVSYYPCLAAHLAVVIFKYLSIHRRFTWIADYGDPFFASPTMQPNNYAIFDTINKSTERRLARSADYLVFTNEGTADAYKAILEHSNKVMVIPHLVNVCKLFSSEKKMNTSDRQTVFCYVGGFHKNIREPNRLFDLIRKLNRVDSGKYILKIYGPLNGFEITELTPTDCPQIMYMGAVERDAAIKIMQNADININVDNENCLMTPSKIVDCISTGRPIINLSSDDVSYTPLDQYSSLGYAISLKKKMITENCVFEVINFIKHHQTLNNASFSDVNKILHKHTISTVANQYISLAN